MCIIMVKIVWLKVIIIFFFLGFISGWFYGDNCNFFELRRLKIRVNFLVKVVYFLICDWFKLK